MKQRIVGALVLTAVAAVVVPIVFDLRHDSGTAERPVSIPPKPKDFTVRVLPLVHPDKQDSEVQADAAPPAAAGGGAVPAMAPAPTAAATPVAGPAPLPPPAPADGGAPQGWAVQVGSFSSEDRAVALRDSLRRKNFTAFIEKITLTSGQSGYRVQVGPELQRADAEQLQARLQRDAKLHGIVVSH